MAKQFVFVVLDVKAQSCVSVDFCEDEEKMRRQARMARNDFGEDYLVIEHPSSGDAYVQGIVEVFGRAGA